MPSPDEPAGRQVARVASGRGEVPRVYSSEPLHHFVDDYLQYLYETHPTSAALDGVHTHDDLLEDMSRASVEGQARALSGFARRLDEIPFEGLTESERVEHPVIASTIRSRIFEIEESRAWERNPQLYADLLATSLATQAIFPYAPEEERARRVFSKLRQAPRLLQAARDNVKEPPGIYAKVGLEALRGVLKFIEQDLPRAFSGVDDLHLLGDLADASVEATDALKGYITYLETELAPRARASFRLGRERFEKKLKLDEGLGVGVDKLLAIASRELWAVQEEFRRVASRLDGGDPQDAWRRIKAEHPAPGELVAVAQRQLEKLLTFIERNDLVTLPPGEPLIVAPTPEFYRWSFASLWTPGPFETKPTRSYYYVTDADPSWPPERQDEHLRDFNHATMWSISMHEAYPGHFVHARHLRLVESKLRKSNLFSPASAVEGWAHYCEQMMIEAGFEKGNQLVKLGQLAEALVRLARFVVGIRLHAEDMSVEAGMRFFRDEAFMEEASARREAERGTFDPTYLVYSAGKLMILKLRADYKAQQAAKYSLKAFHDTLLGNGALPIWAQRRLMLPGDRGEVIE
ncbi:MAG: DUF885 domain-containing protein [Acidobacteria bacterium]|nr:MAG: DUF885 domain-containing protein [Acidobacteriota bacterium]